MTGRFSDGGVGYYKLIQELNADPFKQLASFFCLRSADNAWQFLGLDTALHDFSPFSVAEALTFIDPEEEAWHLDRIREFSGKTMLLSHHQLFSAFSQIGPADALGLSASNASLLETFRKFQAAGAAIPAWFWGHEHNLCIYEAYDGLQRGRCIGHAAVPTFSKSNPYASLPQLKNPPKLFAGTQLAKNEDVYANGFAIVELAGKKEANVEYFQVLDNSLSRIYAEVIS